jgi:hypothetical protein
MISQDAITRYRDGIEELVGCLEKLASLRKRIRLEAISEKDFTGPHADMTVDLLKECWSCVDEIELHDVYYRVIR